MEVLEKLIPINTANSLIKISKICALKKVPKNNWLRTSKIGENSNTLLKCTQEKST